MNILILSEYGLYSDFSASFVHAQATAYAALGHRVRVVVLMPVGKRDWDGRRFSAHVQRREEDGLEIRRLRFLSLSNLGARHFNTPSAVHAVSAQLRRILDGFVPDIIHAHALGVSSGAGAWLKKKLDVPLVVTSHGSDASIPVEQGRAARLKPLCDQADRVAAVSSALADKLRACGTTTPVCVILNGFSMGHLPPAAEKGPYSWIQVGGLTQQKRVRVTITAFARFHRTWREATLTLVGQGPEEAALKDLARELGVVDAVRFTGYLPNRKALEEMAKARFFVMPSVREGFGIVYLEAMACGCITIGTEGEGIADLIVSGENGFLAPPDDPEAIVRTVEWCFAHPLEAAAIAERGRQDALGLTWRKNAEQYSCLFQALAERNRQV